MAQINPSYKKLAAGYLFPEIARRTREFQAANPAADILRLGIGDTTEPLTPAVVAGLRAAVERQGGLEGYSGYGDSEGIPELREAIAREYQKRGTAVTASDIFVSDGAKPDSANIQSIFHAGSIVAVQDPAYPVYVDSNVIAGRTGEASGGCYNGLVYMPCTEKNGFFPALPDRKVDLIYICSPNNPTGAAATHPQLKHFVEYAISQRAIILFDSAYAIFIRDQSLPHSIYEVEGAEQCAIEISSFSKSAGFTGVRLGWTVVPDAVVAEETAPGEIKGLWTRRQNTFFNGASNIAQAGGVAALTDTGQAEMAGRVDFYMGNARIIRDGLDQIGVTAFGGDNAPYVWMRTPPGIDSWAFFDKLLSECHVVGTPGVGFGPRGEGYFRLSAFGHRENVEQAAERITSRLVL
jgi:LL-diaminopimelate aminotransferase